MFAFAASYEFSCDNDVIENVAFVFWPFLRLHLHEAVADGALSYW